MKKASDTAVHCAKIQVFSPPLTSPGPQCRACFNNLEAECDSWIRGLLFIRRRARRDATFPGSLGRREAARKWPMLGRNVTTMTSLETTGLHCFRQMPPRDLRHSPVRLALGTAVRTKEVGLMLINIPYTACTSLHIFKMATLATLML